MHCAPTFRRVQRHSLEMVSPNLERKRFNASGIEGMDPNSSWHRRWSWTRASRRLSSWQVLKPLLRCGRSTSRHQMQARRGVAKPRANYIELHWLRLDAEKKGQTAVMHTFFMLLSSVIVVCSSIEFPVSEFLEFQNVGVGRSWTPSTGLWTLGALSREMWFHCESWTSLIQGNLIPTASRVCADESFHKASLADSCVVRQN